MGKLELFFPVKPFRIFQKFGENSACLRNDPFSIITKIGTVCPTGYVDLYPTLGLKGHNGLDIPASGILVHASHDGLVTFAALDATGGWTVAVRTHDKREYGGGEAHYKTIYCHLLQNLLVRAGQSVHVGDPLGYADTTGKVSGPHLHFGLKPVYLGEQDWQMGNAEQNNGYFGAIDPEPFFNGLYAEDFAGFQAQLKLIASKIAELAVKVVKILNLWNQKHRL